MKTMVACGVCAAVLFLAMRSESYGQTVEARRQEISDKGKELFRDTRNHCRSLASLLGFGAAKTDDVGVFLEDMKLVMIGEELERRTTGRYYIGNTRGARGDSGFKPELRDNSPQAEHAVAAMIIGKLAPPGATNLFARVVEAPGGQLNGPDVKLYDIGLDIGARLSRSNLTQISAVVLRTMCE